MSSLRMCHFKLCVCVVLAVCVCKVAPDAREAEGYPTGFLSECAGSTKPAELPRSQLRHLKFTTQGGGRTRQKYSYWNARNIAKDPRVDFSRKTLLICVGYLDSPNFPIATMLANLYEDRGYNVLMLDNQRWATVHYFLASRLMRPVGRHTAEVLVQLASAGLDPGRLELIGFSLGGQTVSFIAKHYRQLTGRNVSRVTALEPSGPCYRHLGPELRLDASDADFVDVVHTNVDGFGMAAPMGHVDYYVNGGEFQPSNVDMYPCTITCSHFRVLSLWQSAVKNPGKFVALKCDSVQQARDGDCYDRSPAATNTMGVKVDRTSHGVFYLATGKEYPFYLGQNGLKKAFNAWTTISDINDGNETEIYT